jgi:hypothetical protein
MERVMNPNGAASLTSALLVRKGAAIPAGYAALTAAARAGRTLRPADTTAVGAAASPKRRRNERLPDPRTRISLRLDPDHYLKLKLSAAHLHQNLQEVLIAALDSYFEKVGPTVKNGNCACLEGGCSEQTKTCEQKR